MQFSGSRSKDSLSGLYVLKHKDLDAAMVQIDSMTGSIEYILDIYIPEDIPYRIKKVVIEGKNYPCSLSPLFTSQDLEFALSAI